MWAGGLFGAGSLEAAPSPAGVLTHPLSASLGSAGSPLSQSGSATPQESTNSPLHPLFGMFGGGLAALPAARLGFSNSEPGFVELPDCSDIWGSTSVGRVVFVPPPPPPPPPPCACL